MREIKFRAYIKDEGRLLNVNLIDFDDEYVRAWDEYGEDEEEWFLNDCELMQYTGLKDVNGREVYEGDVLDIGLQNQDGKPVVAPVSYEKYIAGYVLDNGGNGIWQRLDEDCEVIGNIFENPELLEEKK